MAHAKPPKARRPRPHLRPDALQERRLLTGETVQAQPGIHEVKVVTHAPRKWLMVDLESGEVWRQDEEGVLRLFGLVVSNKASPRFLIIDRA